MSFLKPEPKAFTWKSILKTDEFMRLGLMILLAAIIVAFMIVLVVRWKELFPASAGLPDGAAKGEPRPEGREAGKTPGVEKAISGMPEGVKVVYLSEVTPPSQSVTPTLPASVPVTKTPPPLIPKYFEGMLDNVKDHEPVEANRAFNYMLSYVSKIPPEEISKRVNPNIKYSDLMDHPEKYRGEFVRIKGILIISPRPCKLATNPTGLEVYYEGRLGDADKNEFYHFALIDRPERYVGVNERQGWADMVWVEGAFFKIERYAVQLSHGGGYQEVPFIIGRRMFKVPVSTKGITTLQIVMVVFIVIAFAGVIIGIVISVRKDKAYQKSRQEKWQKRVKTDSRLPTDKPNQ